MDGQFNRANLLRESFLSRERPPFAETWYLGVTNFSRTEPRTRKLSNLAFILKNNVPRTRVINQKYGIIDSSISTARQHTDSEVEAYENTDSEVEAFEENEDSEVEAYKNTYLSGKYQPQGPLADKSQKKLWPNFSRTERRTRKLSDRAFILKNSVRPTRVINLKFNNPRCEEFESH